MFVGIRSEFILECSCDDGVITLIAKRKASSFPIILPLFTEVLFGKYIVTIQKISIPISYDVVHYRCELNDIAVLTSEELKELMGCGFKKVG